MRTNVVINDRLMSAAVRSGSFKTKKSAIEAGLRLLVQVNAQEDIRSLRGKVTWRGNLDDMRKD